MAPLVKAGSGGCQRGFPDGLIGQFELSTGTYGEQPYKQINRVGVVHWAVDCHARSLLGYTRRTSILTKGESRFIGAAYSKLKQIQLTRAGYRFGSSLNVQL